MKVEVTVGDLNKYFHKAVKYCRLKMMHGCKVHETKTGWFSKESKEYPYEDDFEYWQLMTNYYPWNKMVGIYNVLLLDPNTKIILDGEAIGKIVAYSNLYDEVYNKDSQ